MTDDHSGSRCSVPVFLIIPPTARNASKKMFMHEVYCTAELLQRRGRKHIHRALIYRLHTICNEVGNAGCVLDSDVFVPCFRRKLASAPTRHCDDYEPAQLSRGGVRHTHTACHGGSTTPAKRQYQQASGSGGTDVGRRHGLATDLSLCRLGVGGRLRRLGFAIDRSRGR